MNIREQQNNSSAKSANLWFFFLQTLWQILHAPPVAGLESLGVQVLFSEPLTAEKVESLDGESCLGATKLVFAPNQIQIYHKIIYPNHQHITGSLPRPRLLGLWCGDMDVKHILSFKLTKALDRPNHFLQALPNSVPKRGSPAPLGLFLTTDHQPVHRSSTQVGHPDHSGPPRGGLRLLVWRIG